MFPHHEESEGQAEYCLYSFGEEAVHDPGERREE